MNRPNKQDYNAPQPFAHERHQEYVKDLEKYCDYLETMIPPTEKWKQTFDKVTPTDRRMIASVASKSRLKAIELLMDAYEVDDQDEAGTVLNAILY